jgi:hypothetical protein
VTAAIVALGFIALLVALLAGLVLETDGDDTPYADDLEHLERAARVRDALDRARSGATPDHYRTGVKW